MAIRDRGYKRYEGGHTPLGGRWSVVLRHALGTMFRKGGVITILILSGFVALVWGVYLYFQAKGWAETPPELAEAKNLSDPGQNVYLFLVRGFGAPVQAFLMAMFAGGGAVADDARAGAFQFYFARPLSRTQYMVGKVTAVTILVATVSLAPALLLATVRIAVSRDGHDMLHQLLLLLQSAGLGILEALVLGLPVVALSSLSKGRGYAQGAFAALVLLPWIVGGLFVKLTRTPWPQLLSIPAILESVGAKIFLYDLPEVDRPLPWIAATAMLVALMVGSALLLRARLAAAEVVTG